MVFRMMKIVSVLKYDDGYDRILAYRHQWRIQGVWGCDRTSARPPLP